MDKMEMNLNEMENITGGAAGSEAPLTPKAGCDVYRIVGNDNLTKIAKKFNTTIDYLMYLNNGIITNRNFIRAGFYMYVPKQ